MQPKTKFEILKKKIMWTRVPFPHMLQKKNFTKKIKLKI